MTECGTHSCIQDLHEGNYSFCNNKYFKLKYIMNGPTNTMKFQHVRDKWWLHVTFINKIKFVIVKSRVSFIKLTLIISQLNVSNKHYWIHAKQLECKQRQHYWGEKTLFSFIQRTFFDQTVFKSLALEIISICYDLYQNNAWTDPPCLNQAVYKRKGKNRQIFVSSACTQCFHIIRNLGLTHCQNGI